jgi:hypothetical protein
MVSCSKRSDFWHYADLHLVCSLSTEYDNEDFASTPEYKAALNTEWRTRVMGPGGKNVAARERRVMKLYRAWDPETALKQQ